MECVYEPEFSRIIKIKEDILNKKFKLFANNDELRRLANRFEIYNIKNLLLKYNISDKIDISGAYLLTIEIKSSIMKSILAESEENIEINEKFDIVLLTEKAAKENEKRFKNSDVEILSKNNSINVGEIASQYLSLFVFM